MNHHNMAFLKDPGSYISRYAIACYNLGSFSKDLTAQGGTSGAQTANGTFVFDLRLNAQHAYVDLVMQQPTGGDEPIVAAFIPYLGQKASPDPSLFGCINLTTVTCDLVLTVGFTGCNFVVISKNGSKLVYHEPTAEAWPKPPAYGGTEILRAGPDYTAGGGGLGLLRRKGANWQACVQTTKGVDVVAYSEFDIP